MPSIINSEKKVLPSIRTKPLEEIRLFSRRLSREFPVLDTSPLDVYYRENPVRVPFLWESRPGTPKVGTRDFSLPPLTPPPSFMHPATATPISKKQPRRNNLITSLFLPKHKLKKTLFEDYSPSRSSISSSSSSSSPWSPMDRGRASSTPRMPASFGWRINEELNDDGESPVSTLCFGRRTTRGCSIF